MATVLIGASPLAAGADSEARRFPPPGIEIDRDQRRQLTAELEKFGRQLEQLRDQLEPSFLAMMPDVEVYHKAVRFALEEDGFYRPEEVATAKELLAEGRQRAEQLQSGQAPWTTATGLVIRGYRSEIDGSVQPYGLVVPEGYEGGEAADRRLDVWLHGRDDHLTELKFMHQRRQSPGLFQPPHAFVLHPYGRYCNAFKFAGERDVLEALDHVKRHYPVDPDRIAIRGFSMGGAGCWHLAAHHASDWVAATPGAGFAETAEYLNLVPAEKERPWYERKLWHWYNATDYALNLYHCPTIAYSGAEDKQKQAADIMARVLEEEGMTLAHLLGPGTGHAYHPETKQEISRRLASIVENGRQPVPHRVKMTTWTLRYPRMHWVKVEGLRRHWNRARVEAEISGADSVHVKTENVNALTFEMGPGDCPLDPTRRPTVTLDGQALKGSPVMTDRSWKVHFQRRQGEWSRVDSFESTGLRKRPGLQGPIDDAFLEPFLMVTPSGPSMNGKVATWTKAATNRAIRQWREQFRGEPRVKPDTAVTQEDVARYHLVLWGDPSSNQVLRQIAAQLPLRWDGQGVHTGEAIYPARRYLPVMIYPNPLNPERYIVLNSGFTFHDPISSSNSDQVPKLPDYAVVDMDAPATVAVEGGITTAGFFTEQWQLPAE